MTQYGVINMGYITLGNGLLYDGDEPLIQSELTYIPQNTEKYILGYNILIMLVLLIIKCMNMAIVNDIRFCEEPGI